MKPTRFYLTIQQPRDGNLGTVEEGHFVQEGQLITLTNSEGTPVLRGNGKPFAAPVEPHVSPDAVARALLREKTRTRTAAASFRRKIEYQNAGIV
jgi:hypothetical protein